MDEDVGTALREAALTALAAHKELVSSAALDRLALEFMQTWLVAPPGTSVYQPTAACGSYFFLLWKNMAVTNVSLIEAMCLIRNFTVERSTGNDIQINFFSTERYKTFFRDLWGSFYAEPETLPQSDSHTNAITSAVDSLIKFHWDFFYRTVVFDPYFTSIIVHIPRSLSVDVDAVTIRSGYIHSSGPCLYFRNIDKVEKQVIRKRIEHFLSHDTTKNYFISPYASELFSPYESDSSASVRNGLDGVKINLRKHFIEKDPLLTFLEKLSQWNDGRLILPVGLHGYRTERENSVDKGADLDCTIWFLVDAGYSYVHQDRTLNRSKNIYLVVYAQSMFNNDQFTIFKERKPAWVSSTTIPHTLSSAMVNIAAYYGKLYTKPQSPKVILDPFCGTGTVLFDAAARFPNAIVVGMDREPLVPTMIRDNYNFFASAQSADTSKTALNVFQMVERHLTAALKGEKLNSVTKKLLAAEKSSVRSDLGLKQPVELFNFCGGILFRELRLSRLAHISEADVPISEAAIISLSRKGFSIELLKLLGSTDTKLVTRILFYAMWRALLMNTFSIRSQVYSIERIYRIFIDEFQKCILEHSDLCELMETSEALSPADPKNGVLTREQFCVRQGSYSRQGCVSPHALERVPCTTLANGDFGRFTNLRELGSGITVGMVDDSLRVVSKFQNQVDVLITDPPFGFNTLGDNVAEMQSLYANMAKTLLGCLNKQGQMFLALPAFAKNGKQIPFYQTNESVIRQIISEAERSGRRIVTVREAFPVDKEPFRLPWYWGSASTVERRILHIQTE